MPDYREIEKFKNVPEDDWNNYRWQLRNRITTVDHLTEILKISKSEKENLEKVCRKFGFSVTPYYLSLIDRNNPDDPIKKQAIPAVNELYNAPEDLIDSIAEDSFSPVPGVIHRYPDRLILIVTEQCSMYCRFCTRRRLVSQLDGMASSKDIDRAIEYIKKKKIIRDVLLTGGDPLILGDDKLENIISRIRAIDHVEIIRIGSRMPVVCPQRITEKLCKMFQKYHPFYFNTHFNHPDEITPEAKRASEMITDHGIPLGNQTVLLKGINDCPYIMKKLVHELIKIRIKPYYIYQCDLAMGTSHFRTSVAKGIEIIENLRQHTTGFAVPTFIIDATGGGGKIPVMPNYLISMNDRKVVLRNYEGFISSYTEPEDKLSRCPGSCAVCKEPKFNVRRGLSKILETNKFALDADDIFGERERRARGEGV
ncbi:MAG: lysine 2,3-aminomutase [Spirochaetes bacterium]|nr:lysine 2,3-aminomutase [Spirochaetota bacterium]